MDVRELLELNDVTIDVDLTANRADCFSIRGLAREVGVLNRADVTEPAVEAVATSIEDTVSVEIKATDACPRYLGRVVKNVNVKSGISNLDARKTAPLWYPFNRPSCRHHKLRDARARPTNARI